MELPQAPLRSMHSFVPAFVRSFVHSFVRSFVRSFVSFVRLLVFGELAVSDCECL